MFRVFDSELFLEGNFSFVFDPVIQLKNVSGTGIYTKLIGNETDCDAILKESIDQFICDILDENFSLSSSINPGFYFEYEGSIMNVKSPAFEASKRTVASKKKEEIKSQRIPPFFGIRK